VTELVWVDAEVLEAAAAVTLKIEAVPFSAKSQHLTFTALASYRLGR